MKRWLVGSMMAGFAAVTVFAAPQAAWVPASSDVVLAGNVTPDEDYKAAQAAWSKVCDTAGFPIATLNKDLLEEATQQEPEILQVVQTIFGANAEFTEWTATSYSLALKLPVDDLEAKMPDFRLSLVVENPALDIGVLDSAVQALFAAKPDWSAKMSWQDDWRVFEEADEEGDKEDDGFMAYRAIPEGVQFVVTKNRETAMSWLAEAPIDATSLLMAAIEGTTKSGQSVLVVKDVAELLTRYVKGEALEDVKIEAGWLLDLHAVTLNTMVSKTFSSRMHLAVGSQESIAQIRQLLEMYRLMAAHMVVPKLIQKPDSAISKFLAERVAIATEKDGVTISLDLMPEDAVAILKELKEFQEKMEAARGAYVGTIDQLEADEVEDDDDDKEMSQEEARRILDELDD